MDAIFDLIKEVFTPVLDMGGPVIMLIILQYWLYFLE